MLGLKAVDRVAAPITDMQAASANEAQRQLERKRKAALFANMLRSAPAQVEPEKASSPAISRISAGLNRFFSIFALKVTMTLQGEANPQSSVFGIFSVVIDEYVL